MEALRAGNAEFFARAPLADVQLHTRDRRIRPQQAQPAGRHPPQRRAGTNRCSVPAANGHRSGVTGPDAHGLLAENRWLTCVPNGCIRYTEGHSTITSRSPVTGSHGLLPGIDQLLKPKLQAVCGTRDAAAQEHSGQCVDAPTSQCVWRTTGHVGCVSVVYRLHTVAYRVVVRVAKYQACIM